MKNLSLSKAFLISAIIGALGFSVFLKVSVDKIVITRLTDIFEGNYHNLQQIFSESLEQDLLIGAGYDVVRKCNNFFRNEPVTKIVVVSTSGMSLCNLDKKTSEPIIRKITDIYFDEHKKEKAYTILIHYSKQPIILFNQSIIRYFVVIIIMLFSLQVVASYILSKWITKPIASIANIISQKEIEKFSEEDFLQSNVFVCNEIEILAGAFQQFIMKLADYREKLVESVKNKAIAQTMQSIAHDLKNPISVIELSIGSHTWEEFQNKQITLQSAIIKLKSMADSFKRADLEGLIKANWVKMSWNKIIDDMSPIAEKHSVNLKIDKIIDDEVYLDKAKIDRSIINLIRNAIEAGAHNVSISIMQENFDLIIKVIDDGPGVARDFMSNLFKRGETYGKHGGTGLGLSFVKNVIEGHGGTVTYDRRNENTIFTIIIPKVFRGFDNKDNMVHQPTNSGLDCIKVSIFLMDTHQNNNLITEVKKAFPTINIVSSIDGCSHIWTDDISLIRNAVNKNRRALHISPQESIMNIITSIKQELNL